MAAKKKTKKAAHKRAKSKAVGQEKPPKSKPPKQDAKFRKSLDQRVENLTADVRSFIASPHPQWVLAKEWLHDCDVPPPTIDLLSYIAHEMLHGSHRQSCCEAAFACFIDFTRKLDSQAMKNSIQHAVARLTFIGWWGGEKRAHWWLCRWGMERVHGKAVQMYGARKIAHAINETLVARSLCSGDWQQINELAAVTKAAITEERSHAGEARNEIALQIFIWHQHLAAKLERPPSRQELKDFIRHVQPDCPTSNDAWSEAVRLLQIPLASPRTVRGDNMRIPKLARLARKTGPQFPENSMLTQPKNPAWVALVTGKKGASKNPI
jgi:hypothetical protein